MIIYIIRHGETKANKEGRFQGWTDVPLNEKGVELAEMTGRGMKGIRFDRCFSSPLIRARQTAQLVLKESGNPDIPIVIDDRLKEINMGDWEGMMFRQGSDQALISEAKKFFRDPFSFCGFPGGENAREVCGRTQEFLKELAAETHRTETAAKETVLIAIHGFAMRAMLNFLYDDPSDFWHQHVPFNCEVNILEAVDGTLHIIEENKVYYDPALCIDRYAEIQSRLAESAQSQPGS